MGRKKEMRDDVLQRLRLENATYYQKISSAISSINDEILTAAESQKSYAERLQYQRELCGYTCAEVGAMIGTSHTWVQGQERINTKRPVSKYYLEVFSLIYQVSPHYLLGKTDNTGYINDKCIEPMFDLEPRIMNKVHLILECLCQESEIFELNQRLLETFLKICDAKPDWYRIIKDCLLSAPVVVQLIDKELPTEEYNDDTWKVFYYADSTDRMTVGSCFQVIYDLGIRDPQMLTLMGQLALADAPLKQAICDWMEYGGFLSKPRSFRENVHIEKVAKTGRVKVSVLSPVSPQGCSDMGRTATIRSKNK